MSIPTLYDRDLKTWVRLPGHCFPWSIFTTWLSLKLSFLATMFRSILHLCLRMPQSGMRIIFLMRDSQGGKCWIPHTGRATPTQSSPPLAPRPPIALWLPSLQTSWVSAPTGEAFGPSPVLLRVEPVTGFWRIKKWTGKRFIELVRSWSFRSPAAYQTHSRWSLMVIAFYLLCFGSILFDYSALGTFFANFFLYEPSVTFQDVPRKSL